MYGYVYKTTDKLTNKIYVGRHHASKFMGLKYIGSGTVVRSIKAYLISNGIPLNERFQVDLLDTADSKDELNEKEKYWIKKLDARNHKIGYNVGEGGEYGNGVPNFAGHKHSDETKNKMSKNRKGSGNANFGNHWKQSDELKLKHSKISSGEGNGMFGKHHSAESKQKSRLSHLGKIAISNLELDKVIMIYTEELQSYLDSGWIIGNIHCHGRKKSATTIESRESKKKYLIQKASRVEIK